MSSAESNRQDIYTRVTSGIVEQLERGREAVDTAPGSAGHPAGPITRSLRHGGQPYNGINALSLWASVMAQRFEAQIWMTYRVVWHVAPG